MTSRSKIACLTSLLMVSAYAEMPPSAYYRFQESCRDYFDIKIKSEKVVKLKGDLEKVTWTAEVVDIWRNSKPVKVGQIITISIDQIAAGVNMPGPSRAPRMKVGKVVPAFLEFSKTGIYTCAKHGRSFEITPRPDMP